MRQLITLTSLAVILLTTMNSYGAGTTAGTVISNQASVSYNSGAGTISANSNIESLTVQELVNATLISQDAANISVGSPQTNAVLKFQITNTGNGNEAFFINGTNQAGSDDFDVTFGNVYQDSNNNGVYDSATDALYDNTNPPSLSPEQSMTLWVLSTIPGSLVNANTSDVQITALSKTFSDAGNTSPNAGDVEPGLGQSSTDAVMGTSGANADDNATFIVTAIEVSITKTISSVNDNLGQNGSNRVPGAEVEYTLTISVTGTGTATSIEVTDDLPDQLVLKDVASGIIKVSISGGPVENMTAKDDIAVDAAKYDANSGLITVNLGDIAAGAADSTIQFTTVIQ